MARADSFDPLLGVSKRPARYGYAVSQQSLAFLLGARCEGSGPGVERQRLEIEAQG